MKRFEFRIEKVLVLFLAGCGATPDVGDATSDSSVTAPTTTSEASATDASSAASTADNPTTTTTTVSPTSESTVASDASTSTTTGGVPSPELCRAATTQAQCDAAADACAWRAAYRVLDVDMCVLEPAPDLQCWHIESFGCFDGAPNACVELGIYPRYREIDGELQLLDFPCQQGPAEVESDPTLWGICHHEEFEDLGPIPPVCYCLCGGAPPN